MAIEDITGKAIWAALVEHDALGLEAFCERYGFERTRDHVIVENGRRYGTRVIAAAAHGHLPGRAPLRAGELADEEIVNQQLEREGFQVRELRPPPWTREELVLACSLLFENNKTALRVTDQPVQDLSRYLQQLPLHAPEDRGHNFRSANSVQRKLFDLATHIPGYGKKPTKGGQLDREVLQAFLDHEETMHAEAATIRATYGGAPAERAWALFSKDDNRRYLGNEGYPDILGSQYVYDSKVANHRRLGVGDLIVLRDDRQVLGVGRIQRIESRDGVHKLQRVCPVCGNGKFDVRRRQLPKHRCRREDCHAEFDDPRDNPAEITQYVASYGGTWRPLDGAVDPAELKSAFLDSADQNAIRPVDVGALQTVLARLAVPPPPLPPPAPTASPAGGRRPVLTMSRNGQSRFREALLRRYGMVCAVTGPCPTEVLQAAHIRRFAEHETHNPDEGVLLRADIHLLFDHRLLTVNPDTWQVVVAPSLSGYEKYAALAGANFVRGPNPNLLRKHYEETTATWS